MRDSIFREGAPKPREYQIRIAEAASKESTLVVLPTGMGKTLIAALLMQRPLVSNKKVIMLAPTKPLSEQHEKTINSLMEIGPEKVILITGAVAAKKRSGLWKDASVALATPQTLENDLKAGRADLAGVGLVVFDEAHRCVGKYAYTYIAKKCKENGILALALTASPGANEKKIRLIMETLGMEKVEIRGSEDDDVKEYAQQVRTEWVYVELPKEIEGLRYGLEQMMKDRAEMFVKLGLVGSPGKLSKRKLFELRSRIERSGGGWKYSALSRYAELFNLLHAHELLETQGIGTFLDFFARMVERREKSKAVQRLLSDPQVEALLEMARAAGIEHPKMEKLSELVKKRAGKPLIVFVSYRDQIARLVLELAKIDGVRPARFVGKKDGVSQKEQKETIEKFRAGEYNVLVATQIGEEGLDIPAVDCVIFYEPVPSEIRSIQRRGRTGRARAGEVIVLVTKGTRDEAYYWVSKKKERKMKGAIERIQARGRTSGKRVEAASGGGAGAPEIRENGEKQAGRIEHNSGSGVAGGKALKKEKGLKEHSGKVQEGQTKITDYA